MTCFFPATICFRFTSPLLTSPYTHFTLLKIKPQNPITAGLFPEKSFRKHFEPSDEPFKSNHAKLCHHQCQGVLEPSLLFVRNLGIKATQKYGVVLDTWKGHNTLPPSHTHSYKQSQQQRQMEISFQ
ncbi:hypothetical protein RIF29_04868 [Crotalaria pallida]|uniref:Uncharacterized protein n=1 Tax=Crotalaria pallida TaxID=3830 RepID=A0AAN9J1M0_CROPI